jgi:hypothetical protein
MSRSHVISSESHAGGSVDTRATFLEKFWKLNIKLSVAVLLLTAAHAQDSANDDAGRIMSLETLWNQAELKQDTKAIENLIAARFVYVDTDGSVQTKSEFLDGIKNRPEQIDLIGIEPGSVKVYVYENSAIANGIYREKGSLHGKPYFHRGRFTDTWIKQGSAWVCVASQSTLIAK